ncbi:MAG: hypothetical protein WB812_11840, partial [Woeseiaceae bacterium]
MPDPSERIHGLRIDREAPPPPARGRRWLIAPAVIVVIALGWWVLLRPGAGAVEVETDTARKPPSA